MCGQAEAALEVIALRCGRLKLNSGFLNKDVSVVLIQLNRPFHPGALLVQAGALYAMGDFEHALVSYHKANSVESLLMREKREIEVGISWAK